MNFIKPAGDFKAERIEAAAEKKRKPVWCKVCGRKHPRREPCDLVEYQQRGEYEHETLRENEGVSELELRRHPGRWIHKSLFEKGKSDE